MPKFSNIIASPPGSKFILQGNAAFALGVIHAGYHAATGYPGTPSTEVIDKSLKYAQDKIKVGWSVNEAVAVSTAVGHSTAGYDAVVTMKIPGVFQAADAISTTAFFTGYSGALVIYAATDYVPSSTQHVIDARYFFASARLPVLEPRNHREMYEIAWTAADMSRKFSTPVIVLASGILAHSEALIVTKEPRIVAPKELPDNLHNWMLLPSIARANYNKATTERIPAIKEWCETTDLVTETFGADDWGVIVNGEAEIIVREALNIAGANPSILSLAIANPLPEKRIKDFAGNIKGGLFIIEDGHRFLEEKIRLLNIDLTGKDETSVITNWTPEDVLEFLSAHIDINYTPEKKDTKFQPIARPPSICPGCSYKALALAVAKLKRRKKLYAAFGDIGCSTLLYFYNALDTVSCMGASDSIRQGFALSRPEMANQVISVIGDSTECHSGLDSTRNAVFRNVPGVKIILDNYTTAMTGGQPAPSSPFNLEGQPHKFSLSKAIEAEGGRTIVIDAYDLKGVEKELKKALKLTVQGVYTTLILEGECIHELDSSRLIRKVEIDYEKCDNCGVCDICPGIELDDDKTPHFTSLCTNCGSGNPICLQICPFDAIVFADEKERIEKPPPLIAKPGAVEAVHFDESLLPPSLRVAIRGIGGQGNLFFGKVLSEVALRTPYSETHIVKGDTHGMAQLGGPVISTFSCGEVFSPVLAPGSADVLVVMEVSEILRPGFLELLKPNGTIIINDFTALPVNVKKEDYPAFEDIEKLLDGYNVIKIDANKSAYEIGDKSGRTANVVVIGLLSTIEPFNRIPEEIWLSALMSVSPNDMAKAGNRRAFEKGRL
ncbi:MAG: 2-oxoacid:acceptor oxidoreductase family protein [candidate division Zixibacteria bacterium]|nr:2-oxoacid:acceptor oxidoreductase family protein [Candidatus Tariuqbacter arcticus]